MFRIQAVSKGWMSLGSTWRWKFFWTFQRNYTFCWCIKYLRILAQNIGFTSTWDSWKGPSINDVTSFFLQNLNPFLHSTTIRYHSRFEFHLSHRCALVTQPMLQRRSNCTELWSMDSYIQILCRFQKSKQKVPPPSPLSTQKSPFNPQRMRKIFLWGGKGWFLSTEGGRWRKFSLTFLEST